MRGCRTQRWHPDIEFKMLLAFCETRSNERPIPQQRFNLTCLT
jgi:hypothetical protein